MRMSFAIVLVLLTTTLACVSAPPRTQGSTEGGAVNAFNFARAESDMQMRGYAAKASGVGELMHMREPYSVESQTTIRGNRDTLYSMGVFDLETPLTVTKPASPDRFQSLMWVSQDHDIFPTEHGAGTFTFTREAIGTRYMFLLFRTFADPNDLDDMHAAHVLQDAIVVEQTTPGSNDLPEWDETSLLDVRKALNVLSARTMTSTQGYFGMRDELDPLKHLMGTAFGWGGNRPEAASYLNVVPEQNDGATPYVLNVGDVPVDGFWSVTIYNADGFLEKNPRSLYSYNNVTAARDDDGSISIHFGGDPAGTNYLPITSGWNYIVRLYQPRAEILDGSWQFPEAVSAE